MKRVKNFCDKSCHMKLRNALANPSWTRDVRGEKNPMWGKSNPELKKWNDAHKGKNSPNWKGGVSRRKDGYMRINIDGERHLLHRYILKDKLTKENVVHHIDGNPSNNDPKNLMILPNQAEHARLHGLGK